MKNNDFNQMSPLKIVPDLKEEIKKEPENKISVTKVKFISQELLTYEELFSGFNEIRVITYSYALSFIEKIMHYFDYGEVIIGFDKMINNTIAELFTLQQYSTNYICKNTYLQKRINNDEFRFFVLNDLVSHQKVYLLKADDGRVRTILGSANFSGCAFLGDQIESIVICDDLDCYEKHIRQYETLQRFSTDEISKNAVYIKDDEENADELPIFKRIEKENAIVLHDVQKEDETEYAFHTNKLNKEWENRLKAIKLKSSKDGSILFELKNMKTILVSIKKDNIKKRERELINPQFVVDYDTHSVSYNQVIFNLNPDSNAIISDIQNLIEYMEGFNLFTKDTTRLKTLYWKVLNYIFLSPFIAKLRYEGDRYGYEDRFFPMYMLIYGDSDAGKTQFVNLVRSLMFNEELNPLPKECFSNKPMTSLKTDVKGCPILIDEITPTYWKYAKDIVKIDINLIKEKLENHPTFIMLSNDINNVAPEISKRIIVINVDNRLNKTAAAYNSKKIKTIIKNVSNAFYCEYLRRMFEAVDSLIIDLQEHNEEDNNNWIPDIFKISSNILMDIMKDFDIQIPTEFHTFTWFDYMGDAAIGEKATGIIKDEYTHNSGIFNINTSKNELEIDFSCYDDIESKKKLRILRDELPADVECNIVGTKAVLKLDVIKKHCGINFKKKSFWRKK